MLKKILIILCIILCITCICKTLAYKYNYTEHITYIYKYSHNNSIIYKCIRGENFNIHLDSLKYFKYMNSDYRKNYYIIRSYDDGRKQIINDNYIRK